MHARLTTTRTLSVTQLLLLAVLSAIIALTASLLLLPRPTSGADAGNTGYVRRYAANFVTWGAPPELVTNLPPLPGAKGGLVIYDKTFFAADDINTLYVTISATGDAHAGARLQLACEVDGLACNPGANPVGFALPGWFTALRYKDYNRGDFTLGATPFFGDGGGGAGDLHDNNITYTWCAPFETNAGHHNVKVRLASTPDSEGTQAESFVFLEAVHFFIDGSRVADETARCSASPFPVTTGPAALDANGAEIQSPHGH